VAVTRLWLTWVAKILGAPWLGHGRKTEATLATVCLLYGICLLFVPGAVADSQATRGMQHGGVLGLVLILQAGVAGYGLLANIMDWRYSRALRLFGSLVGSFIWGWLLFKFVIVGAPFTFGAVCATVFWADTARVAGMALAGLPIPGAPGAR
jgi:hypothetical protein